MVALFIFVVSLVVINPYGVWFLMVARFYCRIMEIQEVQDELLEGVMEPKIGLLFDSEVAAFYSYRAYATSIGFGAVTKSSKSNEDGVKTHVTYSCQRAGKPKPSTTVNPPKSRPTSKIECQARINVTRQVDGKYMVTNVMLDHNHGLDPKNVKYLPCNRSIPMHVKRIAELNAISGIKTHKTITSISIEAGGPQNLTCLEKDIRNYLDGVRRLQLKEGDAEAMVQYFQRMQRDNSDFFYAIDVDGLNRLRNVFWADARSREAYKEFGDVITFDTTYLVNRYDMPFAPFVGVNHHGQSILFGCGLVSHEDTETFVWLFKAWLRCMSHRHPKAIITDQCRAMQNAIGEVFPNARHRWCLWHIMKKIPEKLKGYTEYESIKFNIKKAVYDSLEKEDFERNWANLIDRYNLKDNVWLGGLFEDRDRWVPAFVKDTFWAGMSTTQRSESINAFFDGYVQSTTTLKTFVEQYELALSKKVQKEEDEDARCMLVEQQVI